MNIKKKLKEKYNKRGLIIINQLKELKSLFISTSIGECDNCNSKDLELMSYQIPDKKYDICYKCFKKDVWQPGYGAYSYKYELLTHFHALTLWHEYTYEIDEYKQKLKLKKRKIMNKKEQLREKYKEKGLIITNELSEFIKLFVSDSIDGCEKCKGNNLKIMEYTISKKKQNVCYNCFKKELWQDPYGTAIYDDDMIDYKKSIILWYDYVEDMDNNEY